MRIRDENITCALGDLRAQSLGFRSVVLCGCCGEQVLHLRLCSSRGGLFSCFCCSIWFFTNGRTSPTVETRMSCRRVRSLSFSGCRIIYLEEGPTCRSDYTRGWCPRASEWCFRSVVFFPLDFGKLSCHVWIGFCRGNVTCRIVRDDDQATC